MAKVNSVKFEKSSNASKSAFATVGDTKITIPLANLIDIDQEIARQKKKADKLETELKPISARLSNQNFVQSAPKEVVEKTRVQKDELEKQIGLIKETIKILS